MSANKFRPCPFCGHPTTFRKLRTIQCTWCRAEMHTLNRGNRITFDAMRKMWNRRTTDTIGAAIEAGSAVGVGEQPTTGAGTPQ